MAETVISVNPLVRMRAVTQITGDGIATENRSYSAFDRTGDAFTPTTSVPVTKVATDTVTPGSGTVNLDLTALADVLGGTAIDFTGLKVVVAWFRAPSTNAALISIEEGASNGYQIQAGQDLKVYPGGEILLVLNNGLGDVASGDRILDIVGTDAGDSLDYFLAAG